MSEQLAAIIGAGQAAFQAAVNLRNEGYVGRIVMVGDEPCLPYNRPPLCKNFLAGLIPEEKLLLRPRSFFLDLDIDIRTGVTADKLRVSDHVVDFSDGQSLGFDHLVIATGGRPRKLNIPGVDLPQVHYLRTMADVNGIRRSMQPGARMVLIGGGYIGLEVAAVARQIGLEVTILEAAPQLLSRITGALVAGFYCDLHRKNGVEVHCETSATHIEPDGTGARVFCNDGKSYPADVVIVAVGMEPNIDLALNAGIVCNKGIVTDDFCRTSALDIYAAGDCSEHRSSFYDTQMHLQSVPSAIEQGRTAAAAICGKLKPLKHVPWFWSDQYDIKLQSAGVVGGHDQILVRGKLEDRSFAAFYLKGQRLIAMDAVNRPEEFSLSKEWIAAKTPLCIERIENDALPVKQLSL
ncbi:NAD(P)/FAD-dependent oxidoreductase [Stenotrophobium rhamnosiphilum]|uniref:Pyridine nucleotide-disulfide oxidoreductase n=1 Tax=Stenotrophobium rhamnosiphilum TaxID=2029166 RepID=A0A2T5MIS3_9GAMM|nr:FAD-dependent oxidoreductase [Stenotrophobium rhamnosiphilum]PTU32475.1 pyridine nucleotide-disulfide oxidoreductase [Stenotrophobium rhamnosiphilum]